MQTENMVSDKNLTTTLLNNGETYTGIWEDVSQYSEIRVAALTDQAGILKIQQSPNGVDLDSSLTFDIAANINEVHRLAITRQYFRIVIENDSGSNQTFLRMTCMLSQGSGILTSPLNLSIGQDSDSIVTRGFDFWLNVTRGGFAGTTMNTKFGYNSDIDSGPEDIFNGSGLYAGQPVHSASAETVTVVSSSTADTSAGTGARTIMIYGLDTDFNEVQETLILDGTNSITSVNTYKRVFRGIILTGGSGGQNAGTITCRHSTTTANIFFIMPIAGNQTLVSAFTVPNNKTVYLKRVRVSVGRANGSAGSAVFQLRVREEGGVYRVIREETLTTNYPIDYTVVGGITLIEKSDVLPRILSVSDANSQVSCALEYISIDTE